MFVTRLLGTKWVAVARHGLILWENEATSLRIIFKGLPGLRDTIKKIKSHNTPENQKIKNITYFSIFFYIGPRWSYSLLARSGALNPCLTCLLVEPDSCEPRDTIPILV